jgi:hypothetical protein
MTVNDAVPGIHVSSLKRLYNPIVTGLAQQSNVERYPETKDSER